MPDSAARKMIVLKPNSFQTSLAMMVNRNQLPSLEKDRFYAENGRNKLIDDPCLC